MKKLLLIILVNTLWQVAGAQNSLEGKFASNFVITDQEVSEYTLQPRPGEPYIYGNSVTFNANGTFTSGYAAPCGNDCFTHSAGTYTMPDTNHIRFVVNAVSVTGDCEHKNYTPDKDLGLYLIIKDDKGMRLVKTDGGQ